MTQLLGPRGITDLDTEQARLGLASALGADFDSALLDLVEDVITILDDTREALGLPASTGAVAIPVEVERLRAEIERLRGGG